MNAIKKSQGLLRNEPVVSAAVITALVGALLRLLIAFGIDISSDQVEAILDLVTLAAPIVGALVARRFVTRNSAVVEREQDGQVLAGEASELPTNTHVREIGDLGEGV